MIDPEVQPYFALLILGAVFVGFLAERFPPAVIAAAGAAAFLAFGIISTEEAMSVFSNSAPITIAAMFVLSGALVRTGTLEAFASYVLERAATRPAVSVAAMLGATVAASAFINNTPVVIVLIPIVIRLGRGRRSRSVAAADPAVLCLDPRRHLHADRHVDQHPGGRRGASAGAGVHSRSSRSPRWVWWPLPLAQASC
jgi:Na+/H+ antiporter NhaD/arsenite permease-like protein